MLSTDNFDKSLWIKRRFVRGLFGDVDVCNEVSTVSLACVWSVSIYDIVDDQDLYPIFERFLYLPVVESRNSASAACCMISARCMTWKLSSDMKKRQQASFLVEFVRFMCALKCMVVSLVCVSLTFKVWPYKWDGPDNFQAFLLRGAISLLGISAQIWPLKSRFCRDIWLLSK